MKKLNSVAEVKEHFRDVKTSKSVEMFFKTANRFTDKTNRKQRIPYPILIPKKGISVDDYLKDMERLGYSRQQIIKEGIVLYFNKEFVPAAVELAPSRGTVSKRYSKEFMNQYIAGLTAEEFVKQQSNMDKFVQKAWDEKPKTGFSVEFAYVDDGLSKELNQSTDIAFKTNL